MITQLAITVIAVLIVIAVWVASIALMFRRWIRESRAERESLLSARVRFARAMLDSRIHPEHIVPWENVKRDLGL